jgi:hypothetical protein
MRTWPCWAQLPMPTMPRRSRGHSVGQSAVRGCGAVSLLYRDAVMRSARVVRRRDKDPPTVQPLDEKQCPGAGVSASRRRRRQRIRDDR